MRSLQKIIAALILINLVASCSNQSRWARWDENFQRNNDSSGIHKNNTNSNEEINTSSSSTTSQVNSDNTSDTKKLSINDRCIGCGHCVREAASNFSMNSSHKAEVISQENISSDSVTRAINRCPVDAISIW